MKSNLPHLLLSFLLFLITSTVGAQNIGINNPAPDASAVLDISSTDKGLLVPRVALSATNLTTPVTAPATGLMVFNTATAGVLPNNVTPGYYFWSGTNWLRFDTGNLNKDWSLTGNAGTSFLANFIGTTDPQPLSFRVNNIRSGQIHHTNGNTYFGFQSGIVSTGTNNTFLGFEAGRDHLSGQENVFIGRRAGTFGTTGSGNILIGNGAGIFNTANNNVFVGAFSGNANTTGGGNLFAGNSAGSSNTTGTANVFLGNNAGSNNTSGSSMIMIGSNARAGFGAVSNSIAIGTNSQVDAINSMVLGAINGINGATATTKVAIGNTAPATRLDVAGDVAHRETVFSIPGSNFFASFINTGESSFVRLANATTDFTLGGISNSANGKIVTLVNATPFSATFPNCLPAAGVNGIITGGGNLVVRDSGSVTLQYSSIAQKWIVISYANATLSEEKQNTIRSVVGTVGAFASPTAFTPMPQMTISFTPKDTVVLVIFSASGANVNTCGQRSLNFILNNNAVPVVSSQTSIEDIVNGTPKIWDINMTYPVPVTPNVVNTISIDWASPGCNGVGNGPGTPVPGAFGSYRSLTVIETGGDGSFTAIGPAPTAPDWKINGNSGTVSGVSFIGTTDNSTLSFRVNNQHAGTIDHLNHNTSYGFRAGNSPFVSGDFNVSVGDSAGLSLSTGQGNTLVGYRAGRSILNGTGNSIFGRESGISVLAGGNAIFGHQTARNLITGASNSIFGNNTLTGLTFGNGNTILGSGFNPPAISDFNVQIGFSSVPFHSAVGTNNIIIGTNAGAPNPKIISLNNTIIGAQAQLGNSAVADSNNTLLGAFAILDDIAGTGQKFNTVIGAGAKVEAPVNASAIGAKALATNSNTLVLGSIAGINTATTTVNVGIGTSDPVRRLHVRGNGPSGATPIGSAIGYFENNAAGFLVIQTPDATENGIIFGRPGIGTSSGIIYNNVANTDGLTFRTGSNTTRMTLTSTGNLGVGVAAPVERLEVAGNVDATGDLYTGALNGVFNSGGGNMNVNINIIADAAPTPLNANGDEDLYIADVLELGVQGFKPGGGSWAAASDARLKKDVQNFTDGLDKILAIRPVSFKYNDHFKSLNNNKTYIGVLAQEIKEVAPYTVELTKFGQVNEEDENGVEHVKKEGEEFYTYDSSSLTYMLINAVKELKSLNDEQQKMIEDLKKEVENLKSAK
jgi:hypothetical protein